MYNNRKRKHTRSISCTYLLKQHSNAHTHTRTHASTLGYQPLSACIIICLRRCVCNTSSSSSSQKSSSFLIDEITACCTGWLCDGCFGGLPLLLFVRLLYTVHFHHIHSFTHSFIISWCVYVLCIVDFFFFSVRSICFDRAMSAFGRFFPWLMLPLLLPLLLLWLTFGACWCWRSIARGSCLMRLSSPIIHFICHGHSQYWRHHH